MVFVDASMWYPVANARDRRHPDADRYMRALIDSEESVLTSNWVVNEALTLIKTHCGLDIARSFADYLNGVPQIQVFWVDEDIEAQALDIFWRYEDKTWGVVDCSSLVIANLTNCSRVAAYDGHFHEAARQFGFVVDG